MMKERIVCNAKTGALRREYFEDHSPEAIDYAAEIQECKQQLADTDYVVIKIAEGVASRKDYADVIEQRATLRARITELQELQRQQTA